MSIGGNVLVRAGAREGKGLYPLPRRHRFNEAAETHVGRDNIAHLL